MLDYTTREKKVLPVKLIDGRTALLCPPKKALYTKLTALEDKLKDTDDVGELYDEVLQLTADILSTNKSGTQFTASDVDAIMDIEDMALLIFEYSKYAGQIVKSPN